jgi:hypothetical protein
VRSVAALIASRRLTAHGVLTGTGLLLLPIGVLLVALAVWGVLIAAGAGTFMLGVVLVLMGALSDPTPPDRR